MSRFGDLIRGKAPAPAPAPAPEPVARLQNLPVEAAKPAEPAPLKSAA